MEYKSLLFYVVLISFACGQEDSSENDFLSRVSPRAAETIQRVSSCKTTESFCNYKCTKGAQAYTCTEAGQGGKSGDACVADSASPYCNVDSAGAAACSASRDANCLKCPTTGHFPDFENCRKYFTCVFKPDTGYLNATSITCPEGQYFNPSSQSLCSRGYCVQPKCTRKAAEWRPYNYRGYTYNHYGLYCENGTALFIEACPEGLSLDYTQTATKNCYLRCTYSNSGNRGVDIDDNTKYLECSKGIAVTKSCKEKEVFDPINLRCISDPNIN